MKRFVYFILPYFALPIIMGIHYFYDINNTVNTINTYQACVILSGVLIGMLLYGMLRIVSLQDPMITMISGFHCIVFILLALFPQVIPVTSIQEALVQARLGLGIVAGGCVLIFAESLFQVRRQKKRHSVRNMSLERSVYSRKREE